MGHSDKIDLQTKKPKSLKTREVVKKSKATVNISNVEYEHLMQQVELMTTHLENQKREIAHLRQSRDQLFAQLTRFNGLRAQVRTLIAVLYDRLTTKIENIGKFKPLIKAPEFNSKYTSNNDLEIAIARYDQKAFNQKRTIGGGLRRLTSVFLLKLIRLVKGLLKIVVKCLRRLRKGLQ